MSLGFRDYRGAAIAGVVDDLARLRIAVFRDWPYLYDGDLDYERGYLAGYAQGDTILVAAHDGGRMVGASTAMPLADHAEEFAGALSNFTQDVKNVFYLAESVLLSDYRGQGAYRAFFARREAHARALGFTHATFCGVIRPDDHPLRPATYQPLDPVWRRFGYAPVPGAVARFRWRDIGAAEQTEKPLQFWIKRL
ncbi:GNAT family N-acetyltransferase [Roseicyclus persicicus]|uniref:GNAT family N-acetyltransferase n=1 Tax=Roseicyclus persicicus TaxID=2650661 RepID=A0A7X6JYD8_9RHOB|nr:GNAT family N-acetyltransferase [Roseibacterium persicicum]NKX43975.1 GNAT family N-acetyltransferase [Roseibacterium persicicum]